jgi:hypothetical protein
LVEHFELFTLCEDDPKGKLVTEGATWDLIPYSFNDLNQAISDYARKNNLRLYLWD